MDVYRAMTEVDRLKELTADWDSHDASPVNPNQIESAKTFLAEVLREGGDRFGKPIISAIADPGVALIWRASDRREVDAHFTARGATYLVLNADRRLVVKGPITDYKGFSRDVLARYL